MYRRAVCQTISGAGKMRAPHVMAMGGRLQLIIRDCVPTQHSGRIKHVYCSIVMGTKLLWVRGVQEEPSSASTPGTYPATTIMRWL